MTPSVGSFILVNVFVCNPTTMLSDACSSSSQRQKNSFSVLRVRFMLYLADNGSFSGH
jgi:hypothetical protein